MEKICTSKKKNLDVIEPKIAPVTINWLRPLWGLLDGDYKQFVQMTHYDEGGKVRGCTSKTLTSHFQGERH